MKTKNPKKFWQWQNRMLKNEETGEETLERTLFLNGTIAEESWFDDDITPELFKSELFAEQGPVTIWINSPGGDCVAASRIYSMLMDYQDRVTVKIDGIAASAASVIAMAGTTVLMAPTALMMIHNPATAAFGNSEEMHKAIEMLSEVKESIMNAYEIKTNLSRAKISHLMDEETWMNANKAVELGFADGILTDDKRSESTKDGNPSFIFSTNAVRTTLTNKLVSRSKQMAAATHIEQKPAEPECRGRSVDELMERLKLMKH
jgi:ATP-dependent Clp protease protease subunit